MQEIFYEESVNMNNEKPAKRAYTIFTVVAVICVVFCLFSLFNVLFLPVGEDGLTRSVVIPFVIWLVLLVLMLIGAIFAFRRRHSFYVSYDYTFVSGELRISKVIHARKRKLLYKLGDEKLIKIGRYGSESYKKLKASPDCKEDILTPNREASEGKEFFYIQAVTNVGKRILIVECRIQMIYTIVRYLRRNILESEFNRQ